MEPWLATFLEAERAWLADAATRGVPAELTQFGEQLLARLAAAAEEAAGRAFSVAEAAAATGLHPESIRRRARKGQLGNRATPRGRISITAEELSKLGRKRPGRAQNLVDYFSR